MMNIKNNSGFVLIEALIAVAIVGMIVIPLFGLQSKIIQKVLQRSHEIERILYSNMLTYHARKEQLPKDSGYTLQERHEAAQTNAAYQLEPVSKKSTLPYDKKLYTEKITIEWTEYGITKKEQFAHVVYKPESEIKE